MQTNGDKDGGCSQPVFSSTEQSKTTSGKRDGRVAMKLQQEGLSPLGEGGARHKVWLFLFQGGIGEVIKGQY